MILTSVFIFLVLQIFVSCDEYLVPQNINVDDIIKSDRLMRNYLDCVLGKGKCTPEGEELKKDIPEALQNECAKCNQKHKEGIKKVLHHIIENKPEWWEEVQAKFDPKGEYKQKYSNFLEEEGLIR
ncbi:ejaculatory bulb-specific protein 3-like [Tenebrio molitor]|uniref:Chemosensory protein CSP1 mRNA n=1 Tax=Tenebrio molitor TaxID=7067 RepID=A0A0C5D649_TENMO|nr:chemosensory protein CSP1 [Tenebrio molitor]